DSQDHNASTSWAIFASALTASRSRSYLLSPMTFFRSSMSYKKTLSSSLRRGSKLRGTPRSIKKQRPAVALAQHLLHHRWHEQIFCAPGRADDDIGEPELLVPLLERHHRAVALAREFDGALKGAIGHQDSSDPV